jgi:cell fate (sporulation/competence/biofilm development) regulator YmcA (YheA/YmcA/DUF963 family)
MEDEAVKRSLDQLLTLIEQDANIREFKQIEALVQADPQLHALTEALKEAQKEAVQYAHYGQMKLSEQANAKADALKAEFEENPLVQEYRLRLSQANELLQQVTRLIEDGVNEKIEGLEG